MKAQRCIWHCGSLTSNRSRICDHCWAFREEIYRARKAKQALRETKPLTPAQREALAKATLTRRAKLTQQMPQSGGKVDPVEHHITVSKLRIKLKEKITAETQGLN